MKAIIFFLILALSIGAAFVTWRVTQKPEKQQEVQVVVQPEVVVKEEPTVEVVVARDDIQIGTELKPELLDKRPWPSKLVVTGEDGFILGEAMDAEVVGRIARSNLVKGSPLIKGLLANPSDPSFLAAAIKEGMRAVTISIDGIAGVAGFIYPGDIVDVLITHDIDLPGSQINEQGKIVPNPSQSVTEVLIQNIRIMAIDQRFSAHTGQPPTPGSSATIEVTPIDAQKLKLAETKGKLSLALKSIKRSAAGEKKKREPIPRPIGIGDLSRVTPPSIFPALYEGGDRVVPRTVQLSAEPDEEFEQEVVATNKELPVLPSKGEPVTPAVIASELKAIEDLKKFGVVDDAASGAGVIIIRGVEREIVGSK